MVQSRPAKSPEDSSAFRLSNCGKLAGVIAFHKGEASVPHRKYRALERECHIQAAITQHKLAKEELEKMEREYKTLADWLERHSPHQADQPK